MNRLPAASDDLATLKTQLSDAGVALGGELRPEVLTGTSRCAVVCGRMACTSSGAT